MFSENQTSHPKSNDLFTYDAPKNHRITTNSFISKNSNIKYHFIIL